MSYQLHSSADVATSPRRPLKRALTATASLALVAGGLPLMAGPAQAADPSAGTHGGCTVVLERPFDTGQETPSGKSIVAYPIHVFCTGGQLVHIRQQVAEEDNGPDDTLETFDHHKSFEHPGFETIRQEQWLHNTEGGAEETFHRAEVWVEGASGSMKLQSETRSIRY